MGIRKKKKNQKGEYPDKPHNSFCYMPSNSMTKLTKKVKKVNLKPQCTKKFHVFKSNKSMNTVIL